jgi:hypothetical protein
MSDAHDTEKLRWPLKGQARRPSGQKLSLCRDAGEKCETCAEIINCHNNDVAAAFALGFLSGTHKSRK